jgi:hypothetical protein
MIDIETFEDKVQILSFENQKQFVDKVFGGIHVFFPNVYYILNPFNTSWDEMILKNAFEFSYKFDTTIHDLFQKFILYVWCIFIEFHHYYFFNY